MPLSGVAAFRGAVDPVTLTPIGVIRSPFPTLLDAPRQGVLTTKESTIEIFPEFADGLEGLEPGAELLVVWWAHLADRALLKRPGSDGVFTMRTPHRPNPVALSPARVVRREGARGERVVVTGLDAVDGTPVLDLKSAAEEYEGWTPLPGSFLDEEE